MIRAVAKFSQSTAFFRRWSTPYKIVYPSSKLLTRSQLEWSLLKPFLSVWQIYQIWGREELPRRGQEGGTIWTFSWISCWQEDQRRRWALYKWNGLGPNRYPDRYIQQKNQPRGVQHINVFAWTGYPLQLNHSLKEKEQAPLQSPVLFLSNLPLHAQDYSESALTVLIPVNEWYQEAVNYRSYRLIHKFQRSDHDLSSVMRKKHKRVADQVKDQGFNRKDSTSMKTFLFIVKRASDSSSVHKASTVRSFQKIWVAPFLPLLRHGWPCRLAMQTSMRALSTSIPKRLATY